MPWLKAEMDQPKGSQQPKDLDSSQDLAEDPANLEQASEQASNPLLERSFDTDPKRLEAGLLRINLKQISQLGSPSAKAADNDPPTSLPLRKRLALAWHSLSRR